MSDRKPTAQDVITTANAASQALATLEQQLQSEIDAIDRKAFQENRELTDAEKQVRADRSAAIENVRDSFRVLGFVTAQRLDATGDVGQLLGQVTDVNAGLADDLATLKKIAAYAAIAAKVADALAQAAKQLAAFGA